MHSKHVFPLLLVAQLVGAMKNGGELPCDDSPCTVIQQKLRMVLTASGDFTTKLWDVESGNCVKTFQGHRGSVTSAIFSSDSKQVLTASDDNTAKLWDVESGNCVKTFEGHGHTVFSAIFSI